MNRFLFLLVLLVVCTTSVVAQGIVFKKSEHDLGKLAFKSKTTSVFYYTNNTNKPLVLVSTKSGCGCTKVHYSKKPLAAGASDSLKVVFSATSEGAFFKGIDIHTNQGNSRIVVRGVVEKK